MACFIAHIAAQTLLVMFCKAGFDTGGPVPGMNWLLLREINCRLKAINQQGDEKERGQEFLTNKLNSSNNSATSILRHTQAGVPMVVPDLRGLHDHLTSGATMGTLSC